jgi:hypothetical protein
MPPKTAMTIRCTHTLLSLSLMLAAGAAWAGELTVPHDFQAGERARAAEVNENFDEVVIEVNDNNTRIEALEGAPDINTQLTDAEVADAALGQGFVLGPHTDNDARIVTAQDTADAAAGAAATAQSAANAAQGGANDALAEISANHPAPPAGGLEACPDGLTVADHDTGLLWELKSGTPSNTDQINCVYVFLQEEIGFPFDVSFQCHREGTESDAIIPFTSDNFSEVDFAFPWARSNPRGVFNPGGGVPIEFCAESPNLFTCKAGVLFEIFLPAGSHPDGSADRGDFLGDFFSSFRANRNGVTSAPNPPTAQNITTIVEPCFAGHCDWRLPNVLELNGFLTLEHLNGFSGDGAVFATPTGFTTWTSTQDSSSIQPCTPTVFSGSALNVAGNGCVEFVGNIEVPVSQVAASAFAVTCQPSGCFLESRSKDESHHARLVRAGSCVD